MDQIVVPLSPLKAFPAALITFCGGVFAVGLECWLWMQLFQHRTQYLFPAIFGVLLLGTMLRMVLVGALALRQLATRRIGIGRSPDALYYLHPLVLSVSPSEVAEVREGRQFIFPMNRAVAEVQLINGRVRRILLSVLADPPTVAVEKIRAAVANVPKRP